MADILRFLSIIKVNDKGDKEGEDKIINATGSKGTEGTGQGETNVLWMLTESPLNRSGQGMRKARG